MDSWIKENIDGVTLVLTILLVGIGVISIYSATFDSGSSAFYYRQLIFAGIGFVLMTIIIVMPFRTLQLISFPLYGASVLILMAVLVLGKVVAGSKSWFGFGGFGMQPSELVKVTTILALAAYLSQKNVSLQRLKDVVVTFMLVLLPVALILLQPDLGTAVIYLGTLLLVIFWSGASGILLLALIAPIAAAVATLFGTTAFLVVITATLIALFILRENRLFSAAVFSVTVLVGASTQLIFGKLAPHQQKRILTFLNPDADPLGAGYNVIQSKIAIGSGGLFGKGFLQGTQTQLNFLPAQWTDFIYCVPSEEFGFAGAFVILLLLTALLVRGVVISSSMKSRYGSIVAIGVVSTLAVHTLINVGMAMGIMPVIGVPLPFMSYGGSSLITNLVMVGLLLHLYANRKEY